MVKPILEGLAQDYSGQVDLWQINADDNQELLRELHIQGIPTLIVYRAGNEILRQVGAKPAGTFRKMFETLANGADPAPAGPAIFDRVLRLGIGSFLIVFGWSSGSSGVLLLLGAVFLFSAVYDRCPIWKALTAQLKKRFARPQKA